MANTLPHSFSSEVQESLAGRRGGKNNPRHGDWDRRKI